MQDLLWKWLERLYWSRRSGVFAFVAFLILVLFTSHQFVPGREWIALALPIAAYYGIVAAAGGVAGFLGGERRLIGLVSGASGGISTLWLVSLAVSNTPAGAREKIWSVLAVAALGFGLIPGLLLYALCERLFFGQDVLERERVEAALDRSPTPSRAKRSRVMIGIGVLAAVILVAATAILLVSRGNGNDAQANARKEDQQRRRDAEVQDKLWRAHDAFQARRFDEAELVLEGLVKFAPENEKAPILLAQAKKERQLSELKREAGAAWSATDYARAEAVYLQMLKLSPDDNEAKTMLATVSALKKAALKDTPEERARQKEMVLAAWKQAGAEVGWMRVKLEGLNFRFEFLKKESDPDKDGPFETCPAFRFKSWKPGMLALLPSPPMDFGLDLTFTELTDDGAREIALLGRLRMLNCSGTKLSQVGRIELKKASSIRWISE